MKFAYCLVVLVIISGIASPVFGVSTASDAGTADPSLNTSVSYTLDVSRTGNRSVTYTLDFEIDAEDVSRLTVFQNSESIQFVDWNGFELSPDTARWNNDSTASLAFVYSLNNTGNRDCDCLVTTNWVIVQAPEVWVRWRTDTGVERVELLSPKAPIRDVTTEGPGYVNPEFVYLGNYTLVEGSTAAGERIEIVVPDAVYGRTANGSARLADLQGAANVLEVGPPARERQVYLIVPKVSELQADIIVNAWLRFGGGTYEHFTFVKETRGTAAWLHEYVHRRQRFRTSPDARWIREGLATYLGNLLAYELGYRGKSAFRMRLNENKGSGTLARQATWSDGTQYVKGSTVMGYMDQRVREETDGRKTIIDVFRRLNEQDTVNHESFKDAVAVVVGDDRLDKEIDRYVLTEANPANHEYIYVVGEDPGITVTSTPTVRPPPTYNASPTSPPPATPTSLSPGKTAGGASTGRTPGFGPVAAIIVVMVAVLRSRGWHCPPR